jgi:hypothetical protein
MSSLDKRPSLIPKAKTYSGLGRSQDSKIRQSTGYSGVGKSPETKINEQIKRVDKFLADEARKKGEDPPPKISSRSSEMTMEQKMEALRNARAAYLDKLADDKEDGGAPAGTEMTLEEKVEAVRNSKSPASEKTSEELSRRPDAPPPEQPSGAPQKQQFTVTTDVVEEKPERPELIDDSTVVSPSDEEDLLNFPFRVTSSFNPDTEVWEYEVYTGIAGGITIPTTAPKLVVTDDDYIYVEITRDLSSRVVTGAILSSGNLIPDSDYTYQFVNIAQVNAGDVVQHRFEDIRVSEFLIAEAGELKLLTVFDTTNSYDPPP